MINITRKSVMSPFAIAIFTSAFLVFEIQPIIAKVILPIYGGTPSVWTTCVLFFQIGLLIGYIYSHYLVKNTPIKNQVIIHSCLLIISLIIIPLIFDKPEKTQTLPQSLGIIQSLVSTVGVPFIILSASAPLFQHWFGILNPKKSPYRLYALSNMGSLLGLLSYPFIIEPLFSLSTQLETWTAGYLLFFILSLWCQWKVINFSLTKNFYKLNNENHKRNVSQTSSINFTDRIIWVFLSSGGSIILLAVTNKMCQDIAALPFLWVVPLCLYLLTFILCFEKDKWYQRNIWFIFLMFSIGLCAYVLNNEFDENQIPIAFQIFIYCAALFGCCMIFHGELVRRKPSTDKLTIFYIYIALGGALGGLFVNFIAPMVFSGFWELHISLVLVCTLALLILFKHNQSGYRVHFLRINFYAGKRYLSFIGTIGLFFLLYVLKNNITSMKRPSIFSTRSFLGVLHVFEYQKGTNNHFRILKHGRTGHGVQWVSETNKNQPTAYYGNCSGAALTINQFPSKNSKLKIGAIGMGIGTIAAYGQKNDSIRFYEINQDVNQIAKDYFSYIKNSKANIEVAIGDARQTLENELLTPGPRQYDIMLVDAFNGDAIPTHLLTKEASDLYWKHLHKDGILAFHITNKQFDLSDIIRQLAIHANKKAIPIIDDGECDEYSVENYWILITENEVFINNSEVQKVDSEWVNEVKPIIWTDDFNNLFEIVKW